MTPPLLTGPIVVFFLRTQANPFFGFVSATVLICTFVSLGLVFGPKLLFIYRWPQPTKEELQNNQMEESSTINRTEQLRYQQLLKENAELKRQIELRNIRIQECRRILEGHHALLANSKNRAKDRHSHRQHNNNNSSGDESCSTILLHNSKMEQNNNNNEGNGNNNCPASNVEVQIVEHGHGIASFLDFEPTTSTADVAMDLNTTITLLEQQATTSMDDGEGELAISEAKIEVEVREEEEADRVEEGQGLIEEQGGGGQDTGVCSDYEEEDEADDKAELMSTNSDDLNGGWDEQAEEEEILL